MELANGELANRESTADTEESERRELIPKIYLRDTLAEARHNYLVKSTDEVKVMGIETANELGNISKGVSDLATNVYKLLHGQDDGFGSVKKQIANLKNTLLGALSSSKSYCQASKSLIYIKLQKQLGNNVAELEEYHEQQFKDLPHRNNLSYAIFFCTWVILLQLVTYLFQFFLFFLKAIVWLVTPTWEKVLMIIGVCMGIFILLGIISHIIMIITGENIGMSIFGNISSFFVQFIWLLSSNLKYMIPHDMRNPSDSMQRFLIAYRESTKYNSTSEMFQVGSIELSRYVKMPKLPEMNIWPDFLINPELTTHKNLRGETYPQRRMREKLGIKYKHSPLIPEQFDKNLPIESQYLRGSEEPHNEYLKKKDEEKFKKLLKPYTRSTKFPSFKRPKINIPKTGKKTRTFNKETLLNSSHPNQPNETFFPYGNVFNPNGTLIISDSGNATVATVDEFGESNPTQFVTFLPIFESLFERGIDSITHPNNITNELINATTTANVTTRNESTPTFGTLFNLGAFFENVAPSQITQYMDPIKISEMFTSNMDMGTMVSIWAKGGFTKIFNKAMEVTKKVIKENVPTYEEIIDEDYKQYLQDYTQVVEHNTDIGFRDLVSILFENVNSITESFTTIISNSTISINMTEIETYGSRIWKFLQSMIVTEGKGKKRSKRKRRKIKKKSRTSK